MKLKHKILAYSMIPALLGAGFIGINSVSANGFFGGFGGGNLTPEQVVDRQEAMFQSQADLLGISLSEVKEAWASGTSFHELATAKGITDTELQQKMQEARLAQIKSQLKTLVDNGVITQAQADQRLTFMQNNQGSKDKSGRGGKMGKELGGLGCLGF